MHSVRPLSNRTFEMIVLSTGCNIPTLTATAKVANEAAYSHPSRDWYLDCSFYPLMEISANARRVLAGHIPVLGQAAIVYGTAHGRNCGNRGGAAPVLSLVYAFLQVWYVYGVFTVLGYGLRLWLRARRSGRLLLPAAGWRDRLVTAASRAMHCTHYSTSRAVDTIAQRFDSAGLLFCVWLFVGVGVGVAQVCAIVYFFLRKS